MPKRLSPFRIPKGVPQEIRRQLRLDKPGRFLSTLKALQLHDLLAFSAKAVAKRHSATVRAFERAKQPETRAKWLGRLRSSQGDYGAIQHGLDQLSKAAGREPLPPLVSRDVVPIVKAEEFDESYILPGESALEFEIGVDYTEEVSGYRHKNGRASDVSFNARLFHPDGEPITEYQVREAMDNFAATGELYYRSGRSHVALEVRTVSWANWKGQETRSRHPDDLLSFRRILNRVGDGGLRVGAVKPDIL